MRLRELSAAELSHRLHGEGLVLRFGPFVIRIRSPFNSVMQGLACLYGEYPLSEATAFSDFDVTVTRTTGLRRWWRAQAVFQFDGSEPFAPLPATHALPLLEWSMNWCISMHVQQYLLLHAAVVEREGCAVVLPAPPGSGKSTLCAGLIHRGWRLLSDEMALISLHDGKIWPLGMAVSLKNQSIDVIRAFAPQAVFSPTVHDTHKGSVALLKVPSAQVERLGESAQPRWIVFPRYVAGGPARLTPRSKAHSMLELGRNSFNYMVLGRTGFECLARVVDASNCYDFSYSCLEDAVEIFDCMASGRLPS